MEEVVGRSLYFFALLDYIKNAFPERYSEVFPNGQENYMQIKNDDDLARMFGIGNIAETLKHYWEDDPNGKHKGMDWMSILGELFGTEIAMMTREIFEDKLLSK